MTETKPMPAGRVADRVVLADAVARLRTAAENAIAAKGGGERLVRVSLPVEDADPFEWLSGQGLSSRFFWHARGRAGWWAASGEADAIAGDEGLDQLCQRIQTMARDHRAVRYIGGMRFGARSAANEAWSSFGRWRFVLPRLELEAHDGETTLAVNLVLPRDGRIDLSEIITAPVLAPAGELPAMPPAWRRTLPELDAWREAVAAVLDDIAQGEVDKVVLARCASFGFDDPLDPIALLKRLRGLVPRAFHFLVQPDRHAAFLGASPERLFRWHGGTVWTEAVAGTRPRHPDPEHDARLREELISSRKDLREHGHVLAHLLAVLDGHDAQVAVAPTEVMDLTSSRHLRTVIEVARSRYVTGVDLLRRLHPTPAVAGVPPAAARERIAALEPFDRGWYAGPVGWIGADEAEFAVAIRSGLVRRNGEGSTLDLFSGAGIVAGSDADAEWAEVRQKVVDFLRVLGVEDG